MRIDCPHCGLRDSSEFSCFGDAGRERPEIGDTDKERWLAYVYERDNPKGPFEEFWQHVQGCRQWLVVRRDTSTHEMLGVAPAHEVMLKRMAKRGDTSR